jgi:hypothetical protein
MALSVHGGMMSNQRTVTGVLLTILLLAVGAPAAHAADTAQAILARSIQAHGGDRLTAWKTMVVEGTIDVLDGVTYHAAYRLWAKRPGKLRVEHDLTADRGRRFDQYFLNGGVSWMRRSLIVGAVPVARMQRWLDQCDGVAAYARHSSAFTLQPDAVVQWQAPPKPGSTAPPVVESRLAWVLHATIDGAAVDLYIDKERYFLLQEVTPDARRVFSGFTNFSGRTLATKINEFTRGRQGETLTPITWKSVKYDVAVEDWLFDEDKPVK